MRCGHLMEKMRKLFLWWQCFNKIFSTKSKKEGMIYMGIIYMSFLTRNLLCKNIYTMPLFMWGNELFNILKRWLYLYCISLSSFLIYEASYSFLCLALKPYFAELIFAILGQNHKNKFQNNLFHNNLWSQNFLPLR